MIILFEQPHIFRRIRKYLHQHRLAVRRRLCEGRHGFRQFFGVVHGEVGEASFFGPAFRGSLVRGRYKAVRLVLHLQTG